jgi:DNA-binding NarL/FixJ family response regulator
MGVRGVLGGRYEVEEAEDGRGGLELLTSLGNFDVAIVELAAGSDRRPKAERGIAAIRTLREARPGLGIVAHDNRPGRHAAAEAIDAGATAYVAKSSPTESLTRAVEAAAAAETFVDPAARPKRGARVGLTRRQREILQLFADGHSTARVAKRLGLSTETVRTHTKAILARLESRDRAHAVATALRNNLID